MSSFNNLMNQYRGVGLTSRNNTFATEARDPVFGEDSLTVDDIVNNNQYLQPVREYMIERKGVDYRDAPDEKVVDDFVKHMRYFNTNVLSTSGEMRFVSKGDEARKTKARRAYEIYDNLGNVFVNDGALGAASGVKDYIMAGAKDPTTYLGLLTGGLGKFAAGAATFTGKKAVNEIVRKAAREAALGGAGREAAKQAGLQAGKVAAKRAVARGASSEAADRAAARVAKQVAKENRRTLARKASREAQDKLFDAAGRKSLLATTALDSTAAVLQDNMAQRTLMRAGSQEKYSLLQTGFSSLLGGVAGAAQLGFGKFRGASNLAEDADEALTGVTNAIIEDATKILPSKKVVDIFVNGTEEWAKKVEKGKLYDQAVMPSDLIYDIVFGSNYKGTPETLGGIASLMKSYGFKVTRKMTVSDLMTNVVRNLDDASINDINQKLVGAGFQVGDLTGNQGKVSDLLARKLSEAGATLNVQSQLRKVLDSSIVAAQDVIAAQVDTIDAKEEIGKELKRAQRLRYGQSVWKRMLVSSPATTAINVFGFGQFYIGQTMADIFNSGVLGAKGLAQMYTNPREATRTFQQARALTMMQGQKFRNLLDPYTTHNEYMKFLAKDENKDIKKILFETYAGGVDQSTAARYGIDPNGTAVKVTEAVADASAQISGVRIQDTFTKSQMFMTEMDKYLRTEKNMTLRQALNDDGVEITEDVIQAAIDGTLKSVYAKDYTQQDQLLGQVAKLVETASNTPGIGTIIPFGRFMNNVVASAYQWSPLAGMGILRDFSRRSKLLGRVFKDSADVRTGKGILNTEATLDEREAFGRFLVGSTGLYLAAEYDRERQKKNLGVFEIDAGGGTIVDAKNTFPFSIFLAVGRVANNMRDGQPVPRELTTEALTQLAVGQVAKDIQFGNDLMNALDAITNAGQEGANRGVNLDAFFKASGNIVAGVTRPLDVANKLAGAVFGNDEGKDIRQADGAKVFTQSATKYIDNIYEALFDKADAISGEELRVATREGEIYDPNPLARIFGLRIKPGRTAVEKAYSMAEMHEWTASERTKVAAYDKIFNSMIAPVLEREVQRLLDHPQFKNGNLNTRRQLLKKRVANVKRYMRKRIEEGHGGNEGARLKMASKIEGKSKEVKTDALRMAKEQFGIDGKVRDMDYRELGIVLDYIDYLEDMYRTVAKI